MRIRKLNSVDVKLHDLTKVKLKTASNTSVVQFTAGNNKTCTVRNLSKDTYLDVKTGEVRKRKKSESRYQSPKSVRKSNNRLMDLIRCNTTDFYDGFGRLEQVTKADGSFQKNHYDAEGLRTEMEENGQLVKFLYNEDREAVAEEKSNGNVIRYIRGLGLISSDSEKAKTYYHYVSDEQGSITHVINGEEKESGELPQEDVQSRVLNHYEYDAFGNTIRCEEQVHNRFRYTGEQYDPLTGQYYLRARYYNPVIARFTQEDTYYGDGLNLYTYCQNNPILYHDPTGHGTKENSPYSRKEQQYIDAGADPDTARLAAECYPDAKSKQDLYNKYKKQGYSAQDAKKLANREIIHGEEATKKYIKDNNVKKSGPDYTATSPRDNVNTDWRTQERLNAQRNAGAGKGNKSGNKGGCASEVYYRTMSQADYDYLRMTGELPATNETFISPTYSFSSDYDGITVEFELRKGTTNSLLDIGVGNNADQAIRDYGVLPQVSKGWTENNAFFKGEGTQTNIGLGKGKALEIFNSNIINFKRTGGK